MFFNPFAFADTVRKQATSSREKMKQMSMHCACTALVVESKGWEVPVPSFVHYISESREGCIDPLLSPSDKLLQMPFI